MIKKIFYISVLILILGSFGCKKFLDVNHNPNITEDAEVKYILPAAVENTSRVFGSYILMLGEIWSQHWTSDANSPSYQSEDSYHITSGDYNYDIGTWQNIYTNALMDYEVVRKKSINDENWTYYQIATYMQCYTYFYLASLFENIPLSDALKGKAPFYDFGPAIFDTLITRVDEAMAKDITLESCEMPENYDLIFSGNMVKWEQFANTLKLKIYLQQSNCKDEFSNRAVLASEKIIELINSGATFIDYDVTFTAFSDEQSKDNYMYGMEFRGGNKNMRASKTLIDYLDLKNDPRIDYIFIEPSSGGHNGYWQGDFRNVYTVPNVSEPKISKPRMKATMPFYLFTKAQVLFMLAEVDVRYFTGNNAQTYYNNAILADYTRLNTIFAEEIADGDLTILNTSASFTLSGSTTEAKIENIIIQKWIAAANIQGIDAFFDHNRTGYPREYEKLISDEEFEDDYTKGFWTVAVNAVTASPYYFPKRLLVSSTEINRNPNASEIEVKSVNVKTWWDGSPYWYQQ